MKITKKACQRRHVIRRFKERFGLIVNRKEIMGLVKIIQDGQGEFLEKVSNSRKVWRLNFSGRNVVCVYDNSRGNLVTVYPFEGSKFDSNVRITDEK